MAETWELNTRYRVETILNESGPWRTTLRTIDTVSGATVAVKLISLRSATLRIQQRFQAGAGAIQGLDHPNLPTLLDFGLTSDGDAFLVLEWVEGERLDLLTDLLPTQILPFMVQVIDGLECLALHGLAHLNLGPEQLLLTDSGEIKVLGLGRSLLYDEETGARLENEAWNGPFVAPELERRDPVQALWRSDLYSLAAMTAHLLGARVTGAGSHSPRVRFPPSIELEMEDGIGLSQVLESSLHGETARRPASLSQVRRGFQHALRRTPRSVHATQKFSLHELQEKLAAEARMLESLSDRPLADGSGGAEPSAPLLSPRGVGRPQVPPLPKLPVSGGSDSGWGNELTALRRELRSEASPDPGEQDRCEAPPSATRKEPGQGALAAPDGELSLELAPVARSRSTPPVPSTPAEVAGETRLGGEALQDAQPALPPSRTAPRERTSTGAIRTFPAAVLSSSKRRLHRLPRPVLIAMGVGLVGLFVAAGFALVGTSSWGSDVASEEANLLEVPPDVPVAVATPVEVSPQELHPQIEALVTLVASGEEPRAREALAAISPELEEGLSGISCQAYESARHQLHLMRRDRLAGRLEEALTTGNFELLRSTVALVSAQDQAALQGFAQGRQLLAQARRPVTLYDQFRTAMGTGSSGLALEHAQALAEAFPRYAGSARLREMAASAVEVEADRLADEGRFEEARGRLQVLSRLWSGRPGLAVRLDALSSGKKSHQRLGELLDAARAAEAAERPHEGIALLAGIRGSGALEERVRTTLSRLQKQFNELDRDPPQIELAAGSDLTFRKGQVATVALRIGDDYQVASITAEARVLADKTPTELSVRALDDQAYVVDIDAEFHRDKTVELWVTVTDLSGHTSVLGSAEEPLQVKRKRWFRR